MLALVMQDRKFGKSGDRIVIENSSKGRRSRFRWISDGKGFFLSRHEPGPQDVARRGSGTKYRGMGAYSPAVYVNKESHQKIMNELFFPRSREWQIRAGSSGAFFMPGSSDKRLTKSARIQRAFLATRKHKRCAAHGV